MAPVQLFKWSPLSCFFAIPFAALLLDYRRLSAANDASVTRTYLTVVYEFFVSAVFLAWKNMLGGTTLVAALLVLDGCRRMCRCHSRRVPREVVTTSNGDGRCSFRTKRFLANTESSGDFVERAPLPDVDSSGFLSDDENAVAAVKESSVQHLPQARTSDIQDDIAVHEEAQENKCPIESDERSGQPPLKKSGPTNEDLLGTENVSDIAARGTTDPSVHADRPSKMLPVLESSLETSARPRRSQHSTAHPMAQPNGEKVSPKNSAAGSAKQPAKRQRRTGMKMIGRSLPTHAKEEKTFTDNDRIAKPSASAAKRTNTMSGSDGSKGQPYMLPVPPAVQMNTKGNGVKGNGKNSGKGNENKYDGNGNVETASASALRATDQHKHAAENDNNNSSHGKSDEEESSPQKKNDDDTSVLSAHKHAAVEKVPAPSGHGESDEKESSVESVPPRSDKNNSSHDKSDEEEWGPQKNVDDDKSVLSAHKHAAVESVPPRSGHSKSDEKESSPQKKDEEEEDDDDDESFVSECGSNGKKASRCRKNKRRNSSQSELDSDGKEESSAQDNDDHDDAEPSKKRQKKDRKADRAGQSGLGTKGSDSKGQTQAPAAFSQPPSHRPALDDNRPQAPFPSTSVLQPPPPQLPGLNGHTNRPPSGFGLPPAGGYPAFPQQLVERTRQETIWDMMRMLDDRSPDRGNDDDSVQLPREDDEEEDDGVQDPLPDDDVVEVPQPDDDSVQFLLPEDDDDVQEPPGRVDDDNRVQHAPVQPMCHDAAALVAAEALVAQQQGGRGDAAAAIARRDEQEAFVQARVVHFNANNGGAWCNQSNDDPPSQQ